MRARLLHLTVPLVSLIAFTAADRQAAALERPDLTPAAMRAQPEGRAWVEHRAGTCFSKLAGVLDQEGYSHALVFDWNVDNPSIVDATEALRDARGVDVALLADGARMHAVAPFLSHRRARTLVRYAAGLREAPEKRLCVFARTLQEDAAMRRFQRTLLAAITALSFLAFALGLRRSHRRASAERSPSNTP